MQVKQIKCFIGVTSLAVALQFMPGDAQAFECPNHFAAAQEAIDKVVGDMKGDMSKRMPKADMAQVHMLLDDAKMLLPGPSITTRSLRAASIMRGPPPRPTRRAGTPRPPTCCTSK